MHTFTNTLVLSSKQTLLLNNFIKVFESIVKFFKKKTERMNIDKC